MAIKYYTKTIDGGKSSTNIYYYRSQSYYHLAKYDRAMADAIKVLELSPNNPFSYALRAKIYHALGDARMTIYDSTKAIEVDKTNNSFFYNVRGEYYYELDQKEKAIEDYSKAIELEPKSSDTYNKRAWTYYQMKKYDIALSDVQKAIELNPQNGYAQDTIAWIYSDLGNKEKAIYHFELSLKIFADSKKPISPETNEDISKSKKRLAELKTSN